MGRRSVCPPEVVDRVARLHLRGLSLRQIAAEMMLADIRTPAGRLTWHANTVAKLLQTRLGRATLARLRTEGVPVLARTG